MKSHEEGQLRLPFFIVPPGRYSRRGNCAILGAYEG